MDDLGFIYATDRSFFMYFDEDLILDIRLNTLDKYVDKFIICEAKYNHRGIEKIKF